MKHSDSIHVRTAALTAALAVGTMVSPALGEVSNTRADYLTVSGRWAPATSGESNCRVLAPEITVGFMEASSELETALVEATNVWAEVPTLPRFRVGGTVAPDIRIHFYRGRKLPGLKERLSSYESARTLVEFDPVTAEIRGADIYLNVGHWFFFYECDGGGIGHLGSSRQIALDVVLAHELGHCLGIGHTGKSGNLMREALTVQPFGERRPRSCVAKLGEWDLAAIRGLYADR